MKLHDQCVFCKIINRQSPAEILHQDDQVTAFKDVKPITPVHILVVPNIHIASLNDVSKEHENLLGHLITTAQELALIEGIEKSGYRLIINSGPDAGQSVFHVHLHLIGGRQMPFHLQ